MQIINPEKHPFSLFVFQALFLCIVIYLHSYLLSVFPLVFKYVDIVSIMMLYMFFSNRIFMSMSLAIFAGSILDTISTIKPGFFIVYFLVGLTMTKVAERFFYQESLLSKTLLFITIIIFKFIFIYALIDVRYITFIDFLSLHYLQMIVSTCIFILIGAIVTHKGRDFKQNRNFRKIYS